MKTNITGGKMIKKHVISNGVFWFSGSYANAYKKKEIIFKTSTKKTKAHDQKQIK